MKKILFSFFHCLETSKKRKHEDTSYNDDEKPSTSKATKFTMFVSAGNMKAQTEENSLQEITSSNHSNQDNNGIQHSKRGVDNSIAQSSNHNTNDNSITACSNIKKETPSLSRDEVKRSSASPFVMNFQRPRLHAATQEMYEKVRTLKLINQSI